MLWDPGTVLAADQGRCLLEQVLCHLLTLLLTAVDTASGGSPAADAALFAAVDKDSRFKIERALDSGADINAQSERTQHFTPLMLAAQKGQGNAVPILLERGADTELTDHKGFTAMHIAAFYGEVSACWIATQLDSLLAYCWLLTARWLC